MATSTATASAIELQPRNTSNDPASLETNAVSGALPLDGDHARASIIADSTVPDGGYGWVVIFSCAVITWWFVGTTYSWGILQASLVEAGLSSSSTLSFVGSLTVTCIAVLAIVNARVIRALGARYTGVLGILLLGLGEVLGGFCTHNVGGLFVTVGIIMGIGSSLCFMTVSVTPAQYFSKKRGLANGIVYAGGGLGGTVISFAMDGLIQRLGPAWTFRVIGMITLATGLPAAWLIKERAPIRSTAFLDFTLFRDFKFLILFLAGAVATFPIFVPPFFLPLYAGSLQLSSSAGAGLVAGFNFSSAVGRLGCGFMSDRLGPLNTLFISLLLSAASMLVLWPVSTTIAPLIAFVIINGAANGGFFATMPTVVGNVFGSTRISVAMGMIVTGWAGGYLMGAPIAGYLLKAYGGDGSLTNYHPRHVLCWIHDTRRDRIGGNGTNYARQEDLQEVLSDQRYEASDGRVRKSK
ncbi:major facilitator superfamily domain-containing protein [Naematelia encephala]|uniref:Major facilitator superfamily domain-containing protein n=1 Tax=Naematelia encephala TaxID=71784 RepID=A0A1Y2AG70_9TREE|nr:major facilitator superfamily domain-containing protein [Naematelia encephala]